MPIEYKQSSMVLVTVEACTAGDAICNTEETSREQVYYVRPRMIMIY